eukprot:TRINITY_DN47381_c0_g1_i1.p1 TRINITY_DN47381_c0_g1~~TRINITY_DN47381_c0_g1_i1.p1  ORF type:complete len:111 (-),score=0.84 TRINITY_DN47381_c0_g1_i1:74-406(-)
MCSYHSSDAQLVAHLAWKSESALAVRLISHYVVISIRCLWHLLHDIVGRLRLNFATRRRQFSVYAKTLYVTKQHPNRCCLTRAKHSVATRTKQCLCSMHVTLSPSRVVDR